MRKQISLIGGVLFIFALGAGMALALTTHQSNGSAPACRNAVPITHMVTIQNNQASPAAVQGKLCDKLMFMNEDNVTREIAFGPHEDHVPYDGVAEKFLNQTQAFTITLNAVGTYHWHDHLHDEAQGYFSVSK